METYYILEWLKSLFGFSPTYLGLNDPDNHDGVVTHLE